MKRARILVGTLWLLFGLLFVSGGLVLPAQAAGVSPACRSVATYGSYEFVAPATVSVGLGTTLNIPDHLRYASPALYGSKGLLIFDGAGRTILDVLENDNGALSSPLRVYGDYTINHNCSALLTFADGTQLTLKMARHGQRQVLVSTTPGFVILRPLP